MLVTAPKGKEKRKQKYNDDEIDPKKTQRTDIQTRLGA
jgi:hypothetical protein